jgi:hypothetical protein
MGVKAFVDAGGSYNDILGIFGELQNMIILYYLAEDTKTARFLGHELDAGGKKIGVDVALASIGF